MRQRIRVLAAGHIKALAAIVKGYGAAGAELPLLIGAAGTVREHYCGTVGIVGSQTLFSVRARLDEKVASKGRSRMR